MKIQNLHTLKCIRRTPPIELWECPNITNLTFHNTCLTLSDLKNFDKLSILKIKFLNYHWYEPILFSPQMFPCLTELVLKNIYCDHILDMDCFPILQKFTLINCDGFTIKGTLQVPLQSLVIKCYNEYRNIDFVFSLHSITSLHYNGKKEYDLQCLTNLIDLDLSGGSVTETNWLQSLDKLTYLNLSDTDFNGVANFPKSLTHLDVSNNPVDELKELPNSLIYLNISETDINDISFVSNLTNLVFLDASATRITSFLNLPQSLETLKLSQNNIYDISDCRNLSSLKTLEIADTNVSNIKVLYHLTNLKSLKLNKSLVSSYDISMLLKNRKIDTDVKVYNFRKRK
jgi:hypothetical protein